MKIHNKLIVNPKTTGGSLIQNGFHWMTTTDGSYTYMHVKTNIPYQSNQMYYIEAQGYNYGAAASIESVWVGYPYSGSTVIIAQDVKNWAPGITALDSYYSADNYVCLRATMPNTYYIGVTFNAIMANPNGFGFEVSVLASTFNNTSGNHY